MTCRDERKGRRPREMHSTPPEVHSESVVSPVRKLITLLAIVNLLIPAGMLLTAGRQGNSWSEFLAAVIGFALWHGMGSAAFLRLVRGSVGRVVEWSAVFGLLILMPPLPFFYAAVLADGDPGGFPFIWGPLLQVGVAMIIGVTAKGHRSIRRRLWPKTPIPPLGR